MVTPTFTEYANPPYQPAMRLVSNITKSNPAIVTTSIPHLYETGLIVRLYVPFDFGMVQMDQLFAAITVLDATMFAIDIDSTLFDPYSNPGNNLAQTSMAVPIGEINQILTEAVTNLLPNAIPIQDAPIPVPPTFIGLPQ